MALNTIADMTAERIRRAAAALRADNDTYTGDLGFRVLQLDSSNIRAWDPSPADLEQSLRDSVQHVLEGRSEDDVLSELLLKRGLDLCVPVAERCIAGHRLYAVADGSLIACLSSTIASDEVQALAAGIVKWQRERAPGADTSCVFIDDAFADDVAKVNMTAILQQCGIQNIRSL